ncbi:MAG: conjugative transposon protein TraM [Chitinophagaceae bacterium]|nr:conjugative transposon protein TraM [Chitinophagaceae bacterium]
MKRVMQLQQGLRKRKLMMILPLLVIPFLTLAFWALGGGKGNSQHLTTNNNEGLNLKLPDAKEKEETLLDKLGFYNQADKDSVQLAEWMRSDPYFRQQMMMKQEPSLLDLEEMTEATASNYNQRLHLSPYTETKQKPEDEVMKKLSLLQKQLETNAAGISDPGEGYPSYSSSPDFAGEVSRLENMMNHMNSGSEDVEIKQLSNVMDKILDIRHPDRVKERMKEKETTALTNVFPVLSVSSGDTTVTGFFGINQDSIQVQSNAIKAVVNENQVLVTGSVIKLRLLQDIYINGSKIPIGNFVFGTVSLNGERLEITINSIRCGNSLFPVKMDVYDMDGLSGIYVPGAITRDVAKQSTDNSLQLMELSSFDPSFKAQAATAGINTVKSLLSRKVKQVKVMVKAGYNVLLQDKSNQ